MKIHQVKGRVVNSYIVEQKEGLFVVDVALHGEKYVVGCIENVLGYEVNVVHLVVCTHDDPDHSGGVAALARECGAKVGLPYASYSLSKKLWHDPAGLYYRIVTALQEGLRPRMWRMYLNPKRTTRTKQTPVRHVKVRSRLSDRTIPPDFRIKHRQALPHFPDWILLHTPGHSWDSCSYFHAPTHSLITGDTLLGSKKRNEIVLPSVYANPKQMGRTLAMLKSLNPTSIYPGHGIVFHGEGLLDHL